MSDLAWISRAACGPDTAEVFHQASQEQQQHEYSRQRAIRIALSICGGCEVREECHLYMLEQPQLMRANTIAAGLVWDRKGRPKLPRALPERACGHCGAMFEPLYPLPLGWTDLEGSATPSSRR